MPQNHHEHNTDIYNLQRFIDAQNYNNTYDTALREIQNGSKETHWIWFIFPQCLGLGNSSTSIKYGITGIEEAKAYMNNELLRERLLEICEALYLLETDDIMSVMWEIDCYKVRSCVTLFRYVSPDYDIFQKILDKYFRSDHCYRTIEILENL